MKKLASLLLVVLAATVPPLRAAEDLFTLTPIVEGVYAAISHPAYKTNCNAVVVLLDDGVLVVDTHSKPSAARELIAQIKKVTDKPVKYVVNTHFHWDHFQGNQSYVGVWPAGIEIISSETTRQNIEQLGAPRVKSQILAMPKAIYQLKADLARATDPREKETLTNNLGAAESYLAELKSMQVTVPTLTFDRSFALHRPTRTVQIMWLGNAHTDGDVFVYLPKEKILVGGDALHGWLPFMSDSYPYDWIKTLATVEKLDIDYLVGGHGGVMRGKGQIELWRNYLGDLLAETTKAYTDGGTMNEIVAKVVPILGQKYQTKFPDFTARVPANIEKAYRVISGDTK